MRTMRITVSAMVAVFMLGACGGTNPQPEPGGPVHSSPAQPSPTGQPGSPSATPTGQPGRPSPTPPAGPGSAPPGMPTTKPQTLTGTITEGVEPNCLLLDEYLLVGGPRDVLRPGARVKVTGQVRSDLMTTCQQGTPFLVERAERN
ncbi:MAG TPA: hypothetical protein VFX60_16175 [Micromonospora sp.]|nr:hypothetical protein [Micromonospora sp.]